MSRLLQRVAARQRSTLPTSSKRLIPKVVNNTPSRGLVSTPTLDEFLNANLAYDDSSAPSTSSWPAEQMRQKMVAMKTRILLDLMSRPNPQMNAVWHAYEDLMAFAVLDVSEIIWEMVARKYFDFWPCSLQRSTLKLLSVFHWSRLFFRRRACRQGW